MPAGMEAGTLVAETRRTLGERIRETARQRPAMVALAILGLILIAMVASKGLHDVAQRSVNGLST